MRYTGPRNRIARREGIDLGLKTQGTKSQASLLKRLNILPGQHGVKGGRRKISERAAQLREKQKLRFIFGLSENQLKRYFKESSSKKGNTALYVCRYLERRLDNTVYRLGFAPTRASARQLVSHGHIKVNDHRMTIPSHQMKVNDIISFSNDKIDHVPYIEKSLANKDLVLPKWIERKGFLGKMIGEPTGEFIESQINLRSIIEYYSR